MHLVTTVVDFSLSVNPRSCVAVATIEQTAEIDGGTGKFAAASGSFVGGLSGRIVLARNPMAAAPNARASKVTPRGARPPPTPALCVRDPFLRQEVGLPAPRSSRARARDAAMQRSGRPPPRTAVHGRGLAMHSTSRQNWDMLRSEVRQLVLEQITFERFLAMSADDLRDILDELPSSHSRRKSPLDDVAIGSLIRVLWDRTADQEPPGRGQPESASLEPGRGAGLSGHESPPLDHLGFPGRRKQVAAVRHPDMPVADTASSTIGRPARRGTEPRRGVRWTHRLPLREHSRPPSSRPIRTCLSHAPGVAVFRVRPCVGERRA